MRELILSGLGLYLLSRFGRKGGNDVTKVPDLPPLDVNLNVLDRRSFDSFETLACPWNWYPWKRPAVFNVVPISPGSAKRWKRLCNVWLEMRKIGEQIKLVETLIQEKSPESDPIDVQRLQSLKNKQAFLFNETKRLANEQFTLEKNFLNLLKNTFTQSEINEFYKIRKQEIIDRVFPKTETNLIPLNKVDLTVLNVDTGTNQSSV